MRRLSRDEERRKETAVRDEARRKDTLARDQAIK
jgi:hypothetical protein